MKVRAPAWTLAMCPVVAEVEHIAPGPLRGYADEGDQPRVKLTWGPGTRGRTAWSQIEHESFLNVCEEIE